MLRSLILQLTAFPGAESIHALQGVVVGVLLARAYLTERLEQAVIALTLMVGFAIYETLEQWSIGDRGDIDFQVQLIALWVSALVTIAVNLCWAHYRR